MDFDSFHGGRAKRAEQDRARDKSADSALKGEGRNRVCCAASPGGKARISQVVEEVPVRCSIARRQQSLCDAFGLIYEMYLRKGLVRPNRLGLRILPHQLLETSWVIVATLGHQLVGTISLIEAGELGLPIESLYATEVTRLRRAGRRLGELTCLATARVAGSHNRPVLRHLLGAAIQLAAWRKIDCFTMCVHPRHARLYTHRLGFLELGPMRHCPWVRDQPAVAIYRRVGIASAAKTPGDPLSGQWVHPIGEEPQPAGSACRDYFRHMLDEASPIPWRGMLGQAA